MRELDTLLVAYLERVYPASGDAEKAAFEDVLALSDPELIAYLLKREHCGSPDIKAVIDRIRGQAEA
jgi:succinate dehydrogenase flavin-adding protein (antitoxin of CptAB toxin-antitoxin module)